MVRLERRREGRELEWIEVWVEGSALWQHGSNFMTKGGYGSPEMATAQLDALVKRKRKQSFKIVPVAPEEPGPPARTAANPELEMAIDVAPEDVRGYAVYGDWLQSQGDPRGELIALQTRESDRNAKELAMRLLRKHGALLAGPLGKLEDPLLLRYRWGFVERLTLRHGPPHSREEWIALAGEVLSCPATRFLCDLDLQGPMEGEELAKTARALAGVKRPSLSRLRVGENVSGDLDGLWSVFPGLQDLTIWGPATASRFDLPSLRRLNADYGGADFSRLVPAILASPPPKLESLSIAVGQAPAARDLLDASLPSLVGLGLQALPGDDALVQTILESPLLPRLESLILPYGWVTPERLEKLIERPAKVTHLKRLFLGGLSLPAERVREIREMGIALDGFAVATPPRRSRPRR